MTAQAWVVLDHSVASAHKSSRECPSRAGRGERVGAGGRPRETTADRFSSPSPTPLIALEVARGGYGDPRLRVRVTIFCDDTHHFPPMRVHTGTMDHNLPAYLAPYNLTTYEGAIAEVVEDLGDLPEVDGELSARVHFKSEIKRRRRVEGGHRQRQAPLRERRAVLGIDPGRILMD
jgi:hypothetical protein